MVRRASGGFTVIEVLIAITLLAVALIPLASILSMSLKASVNSRTSMHAREVAASEIDDIKGMAFGDVGIEAVADTFDNAGNNQQVGPDAGYEGFAAGPVTVNTPSGDTFTVTRDVRKSVDNTYSNSAATKRVSVYVSWDGPSSSGVEPMHTTIGPTGNAD
jgi:prepilin-type N-terminal cleavage/methylation domain-containing protein